MHRQCSAYVRTIGLSGAYSVTLLTASYRLHLDCTANSKHHLVHAIDLDMRRYLVGFFQLVLHTFLSSSALPRQLFRTRLCGLAGLSSTL